MLRKDLTASEFPEEAADGASAAAAESYAPSSSEEAVQRLDIQQSLNVLEEIILTSPRIPLSRRTLVDEDRLLEQLDRIRLNLPSVFREAVQVVQQRNQILAEANQYAQEVVAAAEQEAAQRVDELGIVRQAEAEAQQLKQQTQQECEAMRSQVLSDIEQWQQSARQEWEDMRQSTEAECEALQRDADAYAAQVLQRVEQQLSDMLRVVHNGRQSIQSESERSPSAHNGRSRDPQSGRYSARNGGDTARERPYRSAG